MLDSAIEISSRRPLADLTAAYSGARLEQVTLADGRTVIFKHLPSHGDWLTRATGGAGRLRLLWETGLLERARAVVDHTIIDLVVLDSADVVVMRDARTDLIPAATSVSRDMSCTLLAGLNALHGLPVDSAVPGLCSVGARYAMFAPRLHSDDESPGSHPSAKLIRDGWRLFADNIDRSIGDLVFSIHEDPSEIERRLGEHDPVLLHGDAKLENLGLRHGRLVAIDWGDLTGYGPREVDVCWYALKGVDRIGISPGAIFTDYEEASGRRLEAEALDLACIGSLAQMGFLFAAHAVGPEGSGHAAAQLGWWTDRARVAMRRLGWRASRIS